jgi:hypothetical protein
MVFSSLVKFNASAVVFRSGVLFYKIYKTMEELTSFSDRVGFSYLCVVIKKYDPVSALVVSYNKKRASNISVNEFKWVNSWFKLPFIQFLFHLSLDAWNAYTVI